MVRIWLVMMLVLSVVNTGLCDDVLQNGSFEDGIQGWDYTGPRDPEFTTSSSYVYDGQQSLKFYNASKTYEHFAVSQTSDLEYGRYLVTVSAWFCVNCYDYYCYTQVPSEVMFYFGSPNMVMVSGNHDNGLYSYKDKPWTCLSATCEMLGAGPLKLKIDLSPGWASYGGNGGVTYYVGDTIYMDNVSMEVTAIPEPAGIATLASGLIGLALRRRYRGTMRR